MSARFLWAATIIFIAAAAPVFAQTPDPATPPPTATVTAPADTPTPTPTSTGTPTPVWPTDTATPAPTATSTAAVTATPDCSDDGAGSDPASGAVLVMNQSIGNLTLTPTGDVDFFLLWAKPGQLYQVTTASRGVDTLLRLYDPAGALIAENDDYKSGSAAGRIIFTAAAGGWYSLTVSSSAPMDWGCRSYAIVAVTIDATPTATPTPTGTRRPTVQPSATLPATAIPDNIKPDDYEPNYNFETAANIGVGQTIDLNFNGWPAGNSEVDNDYFRIYVKENDRLLIETSDLADGLDTNLIIYDAGGGVVTGNDDCAPGERRSCITWQPGYTGLAWLLAGPAGTIPDAVSAGSRSYKLTVTWQDNSAGKTSGWGWGETTAARTPLPGSSIGAATAAAPAQPWGQPVTWQVTPLPPTPTPTATVSPITVAASTPTAPGGNIEVRAFSLAPPPPTPVPPQPVDIDVTIYYDENDNGAPDLGEGVSGISVRLLDGATNRPLAQTFTGPEGYATLSLAATGPVRLSIAYLGYNKEIRPPGGIFEVRLPALRVPSIIP